MRLTVSGRFLMGKFKENNTQVGFLGQPPDLKNKANDKMRRYIRKINLADADKDMPDFE